MEKKGKPNKKRALIALSGGIDSAVSAWKLIQAGYEVEAAFMKNWSSTAGLKYDECPWLIDRQDALRVAAFLGIPMHTLNFEKQYGQTVLDYFFKEYKAGRTPNPDVMCNKEIKFKLLYNWAMDHGFDLVATGHYAQVKKVKNENEKMKKVQGRGARLKKMAAKSASPGYTYHLARSKDEFKDQTYFIYNIKKSQLPHLHFPIGGMKKSDVRALARKIKLPNAEKKESMGLCFVGKVRLKEFLNQKLKPKPGPIVDMFGKKVGGHQGLAYYTIGQRQGLGVGAGGPWFVVKKDLRANKLLVTNDPNDKALEVKEIEIHSVNWLKELVRFPGKARARFRHQGDLVPVLIKKRSRGHYSIKFAKPQQAIASGQSLVLYQGKVCLGGGVIV